MVWIYGLFLLFLVDKCSYFRKVENISLLFQMSDLFYDYEKLCSNAQMLYYEPKQTCCFWAPKLI